VEVPEELRAAAPAGARLVARAPGRANIIGEHTDYNDGFALPIALEAATYVLGVRVGDVLELRSLQEPGTVVVDLTTGEGPDRGWGRYATAVVRALSAGGIGVSGFRGVLHSEVPQGSGLSSSAALEVALALAVAADPPGVVELAQLCRRAENDYVGVQSGIMDQLACAGGIAGHALLIDCRSNALEPVAFPDGVTVLVVDSMIRRALGDSAYNERREQCRAAARALGVASLRDADLDRLEDVDDGDVIFRRARHVITENARVGDTVAALRGGDLTRLGSLFEASHRSLARDYEVSTPELDRLVDIAFETDGVAGARLTGAGFGGCVVSLVRSDRARDAAAEIVDLYAQAAGKRADFWISRPAEGARTGEL
jgi:galactokinase